MRIFTAKSRKQSKLTMEDLSLDQLKMRLMDTVRTSETLEEYRRMTKEDQDNIKDVGGFVAGVLREGRRKKGFVESRTMATLDMDYGDSRVLRQLKELYDFTYFIYSTHKHTPEMPRLRLVIPFSREVSPEEYFAITRKIAEKIGIEQFDDTTYEPGRLMYWPSTSKDGEYIFQYEDRKLLCPDKILAQYEDWRDSSKWPTSSRQKAVETTAVTKQADPLKKEGIIGAFCRTYSISAAIERFLSQVYSPSLLENRFDYIPAESTAGLVVYDDKFAYSHHGTDLVWGRMCNAFDLVRLHNFGHLDQGISDKTPTIKRPSFKAMENLCVNDKGVKGLIMEEKRREVAFEFGGGALAEGNGGGDSRKGAGEIQQGPQGLGQVPQRIEAGALSLGGGATGTEARALGLGGGATGTEAGALGSGQGPTQEDNDKWIEGLVIDNKGNLVDKLSNLVLIAQNDKNLQGLAYNQHKYAIDVKDKESLPWVQVKDGWNDTDIEALKVYYDRVYGIWSPAKIRSAYMAVAAERAYHPIKDYFSQLQKWDGVKRVDTLLIDYLGAEDNIYTRQVTRKTLVAAVKRIYEPGEKFDTILVLNGAQGIGKSTIFRKLGLKWFSDSLTVTDMRDKTAAEKLQGYWIIEMGELAGMKKAELDTIKGFITRLDDKYRHSYGVSVEDHPRQCIIVGTTNNESGFLRDITGNRRYWPVKVSGETSKKPWDLKDEDIDQIWAEAKIYYDQGEEVNIKDEVADMAYIEQQRAMETDDREGIVMEYLDTLLPENWDNMNLYERRNFLDGDFGSGPQGTVQRKYVCPMEIWCECFGKEKGNLKRRDSSEINAIMIKIEGWKEYEGNKARTKRFKIYNSQRAYERICDKVD